MNHVQKTAKERLEDVIQVMGVQAKRSLGQNFLVSDAVIHKMISVVEASKADHLIEIGPGPGALTFFLHQLHPYLQLIELDHHFSNYWRNQGLNVLEADALKINWTEVMAPNKKNVLVSNLPYQISSSLVIDRSVDKNPLDEMILMFQKEVAMRIRSSCSSPNYGLLTVISQTFWKITVVCEAGPKDFFPPPNVASRVLHFTAQESPILNKLQYLKFVKMSFAQRRKLLKSNLSEYLKFKKIHMESLIDWLLKRGFKETARAEELTPKDFVDLYFYLQGN